MSDMSKQDKAARSLILFAKEDHSMQLYDPITNEIEKFHPATTEFKKVEEFAAVILESYLYILFRPNSVYRLNFKDKNSKWEKMQDTIDDHGLWPPAVSLSGSIYVIGQSGPYPTRDVEQFDPDENTWVKLDDRPQPIGDSALVTIDDTIYCIGGWLDDENYDKETNTLSAFSPSISKWTNLEPMKMIRHYCGAVAVDKKIYVVAGCRDSVATDEVECYDVVSAQWSLLPHTIDQHEFNHVFYLNGYIYTVSRYEKSNEFEKYDIIKNKWHKINTKGPLFEVSESVRI